MNFLKYILNEVKNKRLSKTDALELIRQFQTRELTENPCFFHPLLHQNTSDFTEQRYSSTFTGEEIFLADHVVNGQRVLPGVAYLEMARAAVEQSTGAFVGGQNGIRLKNVIWSRPIVVGDQPVRVHIGLYPEENGEITYEIYSEPEEADIEPLVHSQGSAVLTSLTEVQTLNLSDLQAQCSRRVISSSQCYEVFKLMGLEYGPGHQGLEQVYVGSNQVLAKLTLPASVSDTKDQFILHPSLLDAALQASIGLMIDSGDGIASNGIRSKPALPFALQELEIIDKCAPSMWAHIRSSNNNAVGDWVPKIDIDLIDDHGYTCVHMKGLEFQSVEFQPHAEAAIEISLGTGAQSTPVSQTQEPFEVMTFEEVWQEQALPDSAPAKINTIVCFLSNAEHQQAVIDTMQIINKQTKIIFISQGTAYQQQFPYKYSILPSDPNTYQDAFQSIFEEHGSVDAILYLWPLEDQSYVKDYSCIVHIIQAVAFTRIKPGHILLAAQYENELERCYLESWIGFERSLGLILPNTQLAAYIQETKEMPKPVIKDWLPKLIAELKTHKAQSILYQEGKRHVCRIRPIAIPSLGDSHLSQKATCLITGGCGELGFLLAKHLAKIHGVNLILTGRSPMDTEKQSRIKTLEELGSQVLYIHADVCDQARMKDGLNQAKDLFGEIHGVIHAAGIQSNQSILEKNLSSFQKVLAPKIQGTLLLDELLQDDPLDFICYFSSSSANLGDFGSCDYAIANRFLMAYAHYRNHQKCSGRAIVINWPLWKGGGMNFKEDESTEMYLKTSGQRFLETEEGLAVFERILSQTSVQHLILVGQPSRIHRFLGLEQDQLPEPSTKMSSSVNIGRGRRPEMKGISLEQCLEWDLKELTSKLLKIPQQKLDENENLADFGFDSISLAQFADLLTDHYGIEITPNLFFGYSTLEKLMKYFLAEHRSAIKEFYNEDIVARSIPQLTQVSSVALPKRQSSARSRFTGSIHQGVPEPIAIIGMSGRFPGADTIEELWNNLKDGKECITEIPMNRWDWQKYHGDSHQDKGKISSKWGGFISNIDLFDPLFFEISPREAEAMDPQQRLFLEEAWHALEDAGYMGDSIRGALCGVYVGVEESQYGILTRGKGQINSNQNATLSARIAYALDLKGPNLALTAACSSGLVAIHQACQALRQGDCNIALVGGVNLLVSPMTYISLSQADMLSPEGKCYVFDQRANGLVPGEAVAVVVLKPLSKAILDKDHIYGCIKASGVNYDGRTNGITAPSPLSQSELIKSVYKKHYVDPNNIQYVMAHSIGSKLGDPIEVQALTDAFGQYTDKKQYCSIGSIKPLIGHTFAASGVVSLIATLMAMKHHVIPALPNYESNNEYINFKESPFFINKKNQAWVTENNQPRLGAISTTGISGTNSHAVIEEYLPPQEATSRSSYSSSLPQLIVFSAKNQDRLQAVVQQTLEFLNRDSSAGIHLADMAYTLQVGREAMKERVAILASSIIDLSQKLEAFISSRHAEMFQEEIIVRNIEEVKADSVTQLLKRENVESLIKTALEERNLKEIALLWVEGATVPWEKLHQGGSERRISLPTYPFTKRRCWVDGNQTNYSSGNHKTTIIHQEYKNKAAEFYTLLANNSKQKFQEEYLTFCPFTERIPGFSMTRIFLNPERYPAESKLVKAKQIEMRQVLFYKEDFNRINTLFDIGCGHGTDIIQIAALYPHIQAHGFTITQTQAELGNRRIAEMNLDSRAQIFYRDSSKDTFPEQYDLIIGIEVCCHIRNKYDLFKNMATSLNKNGKVLLMDMIANLRGAIVDPNIETSIATKQEWIDILSAHNLVIDEIIDVSPQIANFLYDPDLEQNIKDLPEVTQNSLRNYTNQSISLEQGWLSYCLFKLKKDTIRSDSEIRAENAYKIAHKTPYLEELKEMLSRGHIPYPQKIEKSFSNQQNDSESHQNTSNKIHTQTLQDLTIIRERLMDIFIAVLGLEREELEEVETFQKLGIGSINAVQLLEAINTRFDLTLPTSIVFEFNTIDSLAKYIGEQLQEHQTEQEPPEIETQVTHEESHQPINFVTQIHKAPDDIAIIGLSCRCAGANGQDEFWSMVSQGKNCIQEIKKQSWLDFFRLNSPTKVPFRYGAMEDIECFDSIFFNISPREVVSMDVTQRILLEECYKALEDAGYSPASLSGQQVGTLIGTMGITPMTHNFSHFSMLGFDTSILAARIAYFLDLKGPSLAINTACSSSLVAVDTACQKLKNKEIDLAIAGGITIYSHPGAFIAMNNAGMLSPTGECRPFDNEANGIVVGDGVGIVVLKRLKEAWQDNDYIYGIIRGSGTNQDGRTSGFTVPSFMSQSQLQETVYSRNQIAVEDIQYIEAHGTATKLGDPIEIHALSDSFKKFTPKKHFCAISSLKANIGHTTAAAGVLSLIKVLMSLKNKQMPPSINFTTENEHINFGNSPVYVNTTLKAWPTNSKGSRLAAINSFGFSGTNAHMVIEEYPGNSPGSVQITESAPGLFILSAESQEGLRLYAIKVRDFIQTRNDINLGDLLYTLQVGRASMSHRLALVCSSKETLLTRLEQYIECHSVSADSYVGNVSKKEVIAVGDTEEGKEFIQKLVQNKKIDKLAQLWVNGSQINWEALYHKGAVKRLGGLPTYPFVKEHYWIPETYLGSPTDPAIVSSIGAPIYPRSHQNNSNFAAREQNISNISERLDKPSGILLCSLAEDQILSCEAKDQTQQSITLSTTSTSTMQPVINDKSESGPILQAAIVEESLHEELTMSLAEVLGMKGSDVEANMKFIDMGLDSILGVEWINMINRQYGTTIQATKVYDYPTIYEFAGFLKGELNKQGNQGSHQAIVPKAQFLSTSASKMHPVINDKSEHGPLLQGAALEESFHEELITSLVEVLGMKHGEVEADKKFIDMGLDSILGVEWINMINKQYGTTIQATKVYDYPTVREFAGFMAKQLNKQENQGSSNQAVFLKGQLSSEQFSSKISLSPQPIATGKNHSLEIANQSVIDLCEIEPGIVQLTMQDRVHKNTFSEELATGLIRSFEMIQSNSSYKVVILTGYDNYFASGGTKEGLLEIHEGKAKYTDTNLYKLMSDCKIPVIAAMQGHGIGAGWCLGMSCDFIAMSRESIYTANFMKYGFTPGFGATLIFPAKLGNSLAQEILFTGKRYRGSELELRGIPFPVLPRNEVLPYAIQLAKELSDSPRESLITLKDHMTQFIREQLSDTIEKELKMFEKTFVHQPEVRDRIQSAYGQLSKHDKQRSLRLTTHGKLQIQNKTVCSEDTQENAVVSGDHYENIKLQTPMVQDIAVIGISGRYPKGSDIHQLWEDLKNGEDCITEIPKERWDYSLYFDEDKNKPGKCCCKWGGFLENVDQFDPLFFKISPREAKTMDPNIRLFLETVWNLLENAGYTRHAMKSLYQSMVGVYVGVMYQQHNTLSTYGAIANRVSHFFNFQGPSIATETGCSSSAIAIHMACESLMRGECQLAIAGGVNLSIDPKKYLSLNQIQIIASHPDSRSFGDGDGFIPAEAVGAVLLKPLSKAIRDRDSILAVIKSTAINHGGHTNGFSIPNPTAQAQLIEDNFKKSGIDPRTISYVEAAANGSALGDTIEITALNEAFQKFTSDNQFCAIGSVKSNIGHPEAASGIAQLTKVILQLQHKQLVPTIKTDTLNPKINFDNTPFYLQRELQEWKQPVLKIDGDEREFPRRATVSSFGAGGSNAHLIIEEYIPAQDGMNHIHCSTSSPQIVVFSAKNPDRLVAVVQQMYNIIQLQEDISLVDFAYTLQIGREAMESRLALIVSNRGELIQAMEAYLKSIIENKEIEASIPIFTGDLKEQDSDARTLPSGISNETVSQALLGEIKHEKIALYWTKGANIPWESIHAGQKVRKIPLPTYPFNKRRCWIQSQPESGLITELNIPLYNDSNIPEIHASLKDRVVSMVSHLLEITVYELDINKSLVNYGFDSILRLSLFQQLKSQIDPSLTLEKLTEAKTTQEILNVLQLQEVVESISRSQKAVGIAVEAKKSILKNLSKFPELIHLNRSTKGRPVFWFHGGLGGGEAYYQIAQEIKRPFYVIQARGWMTERAPLHGIHAMAAYYSHIIQSVQPEGSYDLGGYSLGGGIAYEVTRQLQELGNTVDTIVMLDSYDSKAMKKFKKTNDKSVILQIVNTLINSEMKEEPKRAAKAIIHRDELNLNLGNKAFTKNLIKLAKERGLTKPETQLYAMLKKHRDIQSAYEPDKFSVLPLSTPQAVTCYYIRNKNGLFWGELEPYYSVTSNFAVLVEKTKYWEEWEQQLPNFHVIDVDTPNHMTMLSEQKSYDVITTFCKKLYS